MAQLMNTGNYQVELEAAACRPNGHVRMRDYCLENQFGNDRKRPRMSTALQQWNMPGNVHPVPFMLSSPMDEPSPLGLRLRKSPSLLDLIQMQLADDKTGNHAASGETITSNDKEGKSSATSAEKLKASNFHGTFLKIGNWEYRARNESDLVAKCYFAKHKLVWEVLDGGLKSKIEFQWSDIMGLKADCPENGQSSLTLVLGRQPLFFKETNPQPRKHTIWQPTSDFTDGEASLNRLHFLQCPQGTLSKHFEKLIQCDLRLNVLSRQPTIALDSPYFGSSRSSVFKELEPKPLMFDPVKTGEPLLGTGFLDATLSAMPSTVQPALFSIGQQGFGDRMLEQLQPESISLESGITDLVPAMAANPMEGFMNQPDDTQGVGSLGQFKEPAGIHPSMSKFDLVNYLDNMMSPVADPSSAEVAVPPIDERSIMARVNSLCCLLQKDSVERSNNFRENFNVTSLGTNQNNDNLDDLFIDLTTALGDSLPASAMEEARDNAATQFPARVQRVDSFGDLLLNLPCITSLPSS